MQTKKDGLLSYTLGTSSIVITKKSIGTGVWSIGSRKELLHYINELAVHEKVTKSRVAHLD